MAKAKYQTPAYRAAQRRLKADQAAGKWLKCHEIVCVKPTRDIAPTEPADVAHDTTGAVILGPAHATCNRREGAARGNRQRGTERRRWAL